MVLDTFMKLFNTKKEPIHLMNTDTEYGVQSIRRYILKMAWIKPRLWLSYSAEFVSLVTTIITFEQCFGIKNRFVDINRD